MYWVRMEQAKGDESAPNGAGTDPTTCSRYFFKAVRGNDQVGGGRTIAFSSAAIGKKKVAVPLAFNPISRPNHTAPFIPAGVELSSFQHTHPPAEFSCSTATMAKSARSSQIKANNRRLKKNVFGPIEAARNERLSAKLQELIAQPKPEREVEVEMEAVDEGMLLVS